MEKSFVTLGPDNDIRRFLPFVNHILLSYSVFFISSLLYIEKKKKKKKNRVHCFSVSDTGPIYHRLSSVSPAYGSWNYMTKFPWKHFRSSLMAFKNRSLCYGNHVWSVSVIKSVHQRLQHNLKHACTGGFPRRHFSHDAYVMHHVSP